MVILYEIYEITMSLNFYLSYDTFTWDFIPIQNEDIVNMKTVNTVIVDDVTCTLQCYYTCSHIIFMARCYPQNKSDIVCPMTKLIISYSNNICVKLNNVTVYYFQDMFSDEKAYVGAGLYFYLVAPTPNKDQNSR